MFGFFGSKSSKKTRKFVIILSAGRCGSTYLMNELNKIPGVNIYGENYNFFSHLITSVYSIRRLLSSLSTRNTIAAKIGFILKRDGDVYKTGYTGGEFYNNKDKLRKTLVMLEKCVEEYFGKYQVVGFKEIRFGNIEIIKQLKYFEEKFQVYYIHLTRNIEEQSQSAFFKETPAVSKKIITNINSTIEEGVGKKPGYLKIDISEISHDIAPVRHFIGI